MLNYKIKCRFCGKEIGQIELSERWWSGQTITNELLGIADSRCDAHEAEFGSYSKMAEEFQAVGTHDEFLVAIEKSDYKKAKFDVEVVKIIEAKTQPEEPILGGSKLRKTKKYGKIINKKK